MTNRQESTLQRLLLSCCPPEESAALLRAVKVPPAVVEQAGDVVSRAVIAQALNLLLFRDLLGRVPTGERYVAE